ILVLQNGDVFPSLTFARAGGGDIHLPGDLAGGFGVILFYRGSWSRACNDQLYAFSRAADKFAERSEEQTSELQSLMRISYAVFFLKKKKNTKTSNADY